ncbi:MAG: class II aldolase/adducin family protein [Eubacterium sp.]
MDQKELITEYADKIAGLPYSAGPAPRIILKKDGRIFATKRGTDFRYISDEDIIEVSRMLDQLDTVEAAALMNLKKQKAMILARTPFVGKYIDSGKPIGACLDDMAQIIGRKVPIVHRSVREITAALNDTNAVLLKGRYAVTCGRTLYEAYTALLVLEKSAKVNIKASVIGGARHIGKLDCMMMRNFYLYRYSKSEREQEDDIEG